MKRFYLLTTILLGILLLSCKQDEDKVYPETPPIFFEIVITDNNGNNYIDRDDKAQVIKDLLTINHNGQTYSLESISAPANTSRQTLRLYPKDAPKELIFGPFFPADNFRGEEFTINWYDGTKDVVLFDCYVDRGKDGLVKRFFINGQETTEKNMDLGGVVIRKTIDKPNE